MSSGSSSYLPVGSPVIEGPPATALRKRPAESAWRNPGYPAEVRREMALAREARGVGDIADRPIRVPKKIARAIGQMRLDVVENAPDLPRRKPTLMPDWRTPRQSGAA